MLLKNGDLIKVNEKIKYAFIKKNNEKIKLVKDDFGLIIEILSNVECVILTKNGAGIGSIGDFEILK